MPVERELAYRGIKRLTFWAALAFALLLLGIGLGSYGWVVLVIVGATMFVIGVKRLTEPRSARGWPQVPALIIESTIKEHVEPDRFTTWVYYYPEISLRYQFGGKEHEASTYGLVKGDFRTLEKSDAEELTSNYQRGEIVQLFVCPSKPNRAVLIPAISRYQSSASWGLAGSGALVAALGIGANFIHAL